MQFPKCRLCEFDITEVVGQGVFLKKYTSTYYICKKCEYMFVHPVTWLDEAYQSDTSGVDSGRFDRNKIIMDVIKNDYPKAKHVLDYGSGSETLLARESNTVPSIIVTSYDKYVPHLNQSSALSAMYDLVVAGEVFEHVMNPLEFLNMGLTLGKGSLLLTTKVMTERDFPNDPYFSREFGQHIGFLTPKTLDWLGHTLNARVHHTILNGIYHFISFHKNK
jgi:hypothetical protein